MKDQRTKKLLTFLLSVGGSGLSPYMPGTIGTLAAIALLYPLRNISPIYFAALLLALFLISIPLINLYEKNWGEHDPGWIVIDELVGFWLCWLIVPEWSALVLIAQFCLFRFFDITKIFPISYVDKKVRGGLGVMLDDVFAGLFAGIILLLVKNFLL